MPTLVIGGHTRNIGKTSVVASLIAALPQLNWTAIKITQHDHTISADSELSEDQPASTAIAISEEHDPGTGTDTSRFLAAGARRVFFARAPQGQLAEAVPRIRRLITDSEYTIIESNSILQFLEPDLYLAILDPSVADFKPTALRYLDRVDALILPEHATFDPNWPGISPRLLANKPRFLMHPPAYCSPELIDFVTRKLRAVEASSLPR